MPMPDLGANLVAMFERSAAKGGERPFLWAKADGVYRQWSWRRAREEAQLVARCLAAEGLAPGERVLILSENRPEWCVADLAIMLAGGVTVPAYTTSTSDDLAYLLGHAEVTAVICSGRALAKRLLPAVAQSPTVRLIIYLDPDTDADAPTPALTWSQALGRGAAAAAVDHAIQPARRRSCLLHLHLGNRRAAQGRHADPPQYPGQPARAPGACWSGSTSATTCSCHFCRCRTPTSTRQGSSSRSRWARRSTMRRVRRRSRPTLPRRGPPSSPACLGSMRYCASGSSAVCSGKAATVRGCSIWPWSSGGGATTEGGLPPHLAVIDLLLERLVRSKVRERFGGRLKAMVSGGAPLNLDVGLFFHALGLPVLQGYGQTEASPVISANLPGRAKLDTVGPALDGVELKIAEDGEILVRGDLVMRGYWKDADATAQALRDGWLHTGDIGALDADRYLKITDRKKDMIINSGGDNIAPARVEGVLLLEPEIGQVLICGDRRPHLVALIVPHQEFVRSFARTHRCEPDLGELASNAEFKAAIGEAVRRTNAALSPIERVRRFAIMPEAFSVENGFMTPTLKLRRHLIVKAHQQLIESLYGSGK